MLRRSLAALAAATIVLALAIAMRPDTAPPPQHHEEAEGRRLYRQLAERVRELPGVAGPGRRAAGAPRHPL